MVASSLCPGALELHVDPLWLQRPCVQQYLSNLAGIGLNGCPVRGPVDTRGILGVPLGLGVLALLDAITRIISWF